MKLTEKQTILINHCREKGQITKKEADELLKGHYYYNHSKYVSEVLARMVSAGILQRIKVGTYRLTEHSPYKDEQQADLFTTNESKP
jgi:hypothetical protein